MRNDLFVTVVTAELDKDLKKTPKNLEVRLVVADSMGVELQVISVSQRVMCDNDELVERERAVFVTHGDETSSAPDTVGWASGRASGL